MHLNSHFDTLFNFHLSLITFLFFQFLFNLLIWVAVKVTCGYMCVCKERSNQGKQAPHTQRRLAGWLLELSQGGWSGNSSCLPCGKCSSREQEGSDWLGSCESLSSGWESLQGWHLKHWERWLARGAGTSTQAALDFNPFCFQISIHHGWKTTVHEVQKAWLLIFRGSRMGAQ